MTNHPASPATAPDAVHPLVAYRRDNGLTQEGLAGLLKLSRETVARYETGARTPRKQVAKRISEHTGIPVGTLLAGVPQTEDVQ